MVTARSSDVPRTAATLVRVAALLEREPVLRPANDASTAAWPCPWLNNSCKERRRRRRDVHRSLLMTSCSRPADVRTKPRVCC